MNLKNLEQNSIILRLESTDKEAAIHELLTRAPVFNKVRDLPALEKAVLSREKVMSTGIGRGVAFSHGEVPQIPHIVVALGVSEKGIHFDAIDGNPVHILFLIVNSKLNRGEYLEVLSSLTGLMRKDEVRNSIRCCTRPSEVENVIRLALAG